MRWTMSEALLSGKLKGQEASAKGGRQNSSAIKPQRTQRGKAATEAESRCALSVAGSRLSVVSCQSSVVSRKRLDWQDAVSGVKRFHEKELICSKPPRP
jgi:hypothetical protein